MKLVPLSTITAFLLSSQLSFAQHGPPQKTFLTKSGIDSVLKNKKNILALKAGDPPPLVSEDGQMYQYEKIKDFNSNSIGKIDIYDSVKGSVYEQYSKGSKQKLIYITSAIAWYDKQQEEKTGIPTPEIVISGDVAKPVTLEDKTKIYSNFSTDTQPEFPGGMNSFNEYLKTNLIYPAEAKENNIQGKVYLNFVIEANGKITNITVVRKLGGGTDEEAVRLLKGSKAWSPGKIAGKPVRTSLSTAVAFNLP